MFAVFNRPTAHPTGLDNTLDAFLLDTLRCASRGSRIRGSVMHWTSEEFTDEFKEIAEDRDLRLRLTTGESSQEGIPQSVRDFFGSIENGIAATIDPDDFLNHSKFFLFNSLKFRKLESLHPGRVVGDPVDATCPALYLASANIHEDEKHNAAVLVPIGESHRKRLRSYANDLLSEYEEKVNPLVALFDLILGEAPQRSRYKTMNAGNCKVYLYPRTSGKDTVVGVLKNLLHYNTKSDDPCTVRIVTPRFRNSRKAVAEALEQLYENGARIEVITRSHTDKDNAQNPELGSQIEPILLRCADVHFQRSLEKINIHSKYMLLDGPYLDGGRHVSQKLAWVGTPNLTGSAISSHWEMLMKLYEHAGAYDTFLNDFEYLKENAASPAPGGV